MTHELEANGLMEEYQFSNEQAAADFADALKACRLDRPPMVLNHELPVHLARPTEAQRMKNLQRHSRRSGDE